MRSIKYRRDICGMTQMQMAAHFGVAQSTVVNWESDGAFPPSRLLPALAEYLRCTIDDLFQDELMAQSKTG